MTAALTPALALAYLGELSVDVRVAVVLAADGRVLAGDAALAARAGELLAGPGDVRTSRADDGALLAVRARSGVAIAVQAGPRAVLPLLAHDLSAVAEQVAPAASDAH